MTENVSLMAFALYVRSNFAKFLPYEVNTEDLRLVNQKEVGGEEPFLGLVAPGNEDHEPVMVDLLEGYNKVLSGTSLETVMREFAAI